MENRKKITLIVGIIAFVLALAVFLLAYHWPQKMVWSGMMRPDGAGEDIPEALIEADLTRWNRLFSEDDKIDGSITIDGEKYVYHKPANDPDHPEVAMLVPESKKASPMEWFDDYVKVYNFSGKAKAAIVVRTRSGKLLGDSTIDSYVYEYRINFDAPYVEG